jgi:hypothetical protein
MKNILVVNCKGERCGVYQYGYRFYQAIKDLSDCSIAYVECSDEFEIILIMQNKNPDFVIYNYYLGRTPYITKSLLNKIQGPIHICLAHELADDEVKAIDGSFFHFYLFGHPYLNMKNPYIFKIGRIVPAYKKNKVIPTIPTIGSFGFASKIKGFDALIEQVQEEFDEAVINLHIPSNTYFDSQGQNMQSFDQSLRDKITKKRITLNISHNFLAEDELLDFLASNSVNVFMYDPYDFSAEKGISSAIDFAVAVEQPIAVTRCGLFRHLFLLRPSIILKYKSSLKERINKWYLRAEIAVGMGEGLRRSLWRSAIRSLKRVLTTKKLRYTTLKEVINNGTQPLKPLFAEWTIENFRAEFTQTFEVIAQRSSMLNLRYK